jgi:cytoskeletal protein RodZ
MAPHVALAGLSLSSMSTRLLMLVLLLALVGLLLVKRMRDVRAAGDPEVDVESDDATDETHVDADPEHVDPRSLGAPVPAAPTAPAPAAAAPPAPAAQAPSQPAPIPAMAGGVSAVATAQRAAPAQAPAQPPAQPQPAAATAAPVAPPAPPAPARPARPAGLFAPVPPSAVSAGGRAPGATIVPKF